MRRPLIALPVVFASFILAAGFLLKGRQADPPLPDPAIAAPEPVVAPAGPPSEPIQPARTRETVLVKPRETLGALLRRLGLDSSSAFELVARLKDSGLRPRTIRSRDRLELERDADGRLVALHYAPNAWQRFEAQWSDGQWSAGRTDVTPELRVEVREGSIENSLWDAVETGAVDARTILELVEIFESDFDFASDARPGDRFRLLVESRYDDGEFVEVGRILAARYVANDETLVGVGFEVDGRMNYYSPGGESLKKTFLRSPLRFTRISSGYTHRRPHPVLGGVRPHLAIDYAAPTGTPVWAVADGTVEFAGRRGGNGIQVLLRHRRGYKTYYNHLSRVARGIRPGVRVAQKKVIGYVGATGLATGPHLDYRVSVNGRFVNPLSEKFLPGDPVPADRRDAFRMHAERLVAQLDRVDAPSIGPPANPSIAGNPAQTPVQQ